MLAQLVAGLRGINDNDAPRLVDLDRRESDPRRVVVVHRPGKLGLGTAYIAGFRRALEQEAEAVLTIPVVSSSRAAALARWMT